jgi:hypothetical protein
VYRWLGLMVEVVRYCSRMNSTRGYCSQGAGRGSLPTAEQEEGLSLLILACFISHPLIT